jgi:dolichol-phosphate mannosyltransferase
VWVIVPTYNEAETVTATVDAIRRHLVTATVPFRILIVDDASPDGTGQIADALAAADARVCVLHRPGKEGLARAYLAGFAYALERGAAVLVQIDCDGSHDAAAIPRLLAALGAGADIAIGSRYVDGGSTDWTPSRRLVSRAGSVYARAVLGVDVRDLTGGFKAIRAEVLRSLDLPGIQCKGFGFQIETTYRALRRGFLVTEVPIRFVDRTVGTSKMSWRIALEAFRIVPRLRVQPVRAPVANEQAMRILMLTRGVVPLAAGAGGAELAAHELSRALVTDGHEVTLVTDFEDTDADEFPGLELAPVDSPIVRAARHVPGAFPSWVALHLAGNVAVYRRARRILAERPHDVVHAHGALSAALLASVADVPVIYTEHDAPPWLCRYRSRLERVVRRATYRTINASAFKLADRVGATFAALREDAIGRFGLSPDKITTIANGTNLSVFTAPTITPSERSLDAALRDGGRPVPFKEFCLFVGRLESRKAPDLLLRALAEAPDPNCVFVGDGPMRPELERLSEELGLTDRVAFLGYVRAADLPALYARAQLLVLPSVSEAMPLVVLEAMACGTPVLASRIAGLPSVVRDYETGVLVDPGDVGQIALALRFLLRDRALLAHMSSEARRLVHQRFMWSAVAADYAQMYRSLCPTAAAPPVPYPDPELRPLRLLEAHANES